MDNYTTSIDYPSGDISEEDRAKVAAELMENLRRLELELMMRASSPKKYEPPKYEPPPIKGYEIRDDQMFMGLRLAMSKRFVYGGLQPIIFHDPK